MTAKKKADRDETVHYQPTGEPVLVVRDDPEADLTPAPSAATRARQAEMRLYDLVDEIAGGPNAGPILCRVGQQVCHVMAALISFSE